MGHATRATTVDIALAADMCVDLVVRGDVRPRFAQVEQLVEDYALDIGGSANLFACQAAKLGLATAVLGRVGDDALGAHLLDRLEREGVDVSRVSRARGLKTGIGVTLCQPNDRAILTYLGSIDALGAADLPAAPERLCRHWHVASYYLLERLRPAWPPFLERARARGVTTSLDPNWDPRGHWAPIRATLPHLDLFFPNEAELHAITGEPDPLRAARMIAAYGPTVVVKRGAEGALAVSAERVEELAPAEVGRVEVVDGVGAGDNFDAGFLSSWLAGEPLTACLRRGHRCAAASLGAIGGVAAQLRARDLDAAEAG